MRSKHGRFDLNPTASVMSILVFFYSKHPDHDQFGEV